MNLMKCLSLNQHHCDLLPFVELWRRLRLEEVEDAYRIYTT